MPERLDRCTGSTTDGFEAQSAKALETDEENKNIQVEHFTHSTNQRQPFGRSALAARPPSCDLLSQLRLDRR
jgi:hypothetical protein